MSDSGEWVITIVDVNVLKGFDLFSKADLYVKLKLGDKIYKTKTCKNENNPIWNETFSVPMDNMTDVELEVMDDDIFKDDKVGMINIYRDQFPISFGEEKEYSIPLCHKNKDIGKLHIRIRNGNMNMNKNSNTSSSLGNEERLNNNNNNQVLNQNEDNNNDHHHHGHHISNYNEDHNSTSKMGAMTGAIMDYKNDKKNDHALEHEHEHQYQQPLHRGTIHDEDYKDRMPTVDNNHMHSNYNNMNDINNNNYNTPQVPLNTLQTGNNADLVGSSQIIMNPDLNLTDKELKNKNKKDKKHKHDHHHRKVILPEKHHHYEDGYSTSTSESSNEGERRRAAEGKLGTHEATSDTNLKTIPNDYHNSSNPNANLNDVNANTNANAHVANNNYQY